MASEHFDLLVAGGMGNRFGLAGCALSLEMGNSDWIVHCWPYEYPTDSLNGVQTDKYQSLHIRQH